METEIIIVKFWAFFFIAFSIPLIASKSTLTSLIELSKDKTFIFITGFISLVMCIPLILINNVWRADIVGFTTFIAWMGIVKGMIRIYKPELLISLSDKFTVSSLRAAGFITLIIGIAMAYAGYNPY